MVDVDDAEKKFDREIIAVCCNVFGSLKNCKEFVSCWTADKKLLQMGEHNNNNMMVIMAIK